MEITLELSGDKSRPAYMRLADAVREGILAGRFRPGEKMPASRRLAATLGMARNTVLEAYEQLLAEGYLSSRHGSGTFVAERLPDEAFRAPEILAAPPRAPIGEARMSAFARRVLTSGAFDQAAGERQASRIEFRYGTPSLEEFPMDAWRTLTKRVLDYPPAELLGYGPTQGLPRLREALAHYLEVSRGVRCSADDVIIVNGSQQALDLAARVLVDPGDEVVIEEPCYQGARIVFEANGAVLHPVPCDDEGLICDLLPGRAAAAYVTPSHQFPTGAVMSAPRRLELLQWAERTGATIIEDDYDSEFRYEGRPLAALQGLDRSGRVIYTRTFSKVLLPALRMGYVVAPPHLREPMIGAKWLADRHVAMLYQAVLALFIEEGHFERHLRRMRKVYDRRRTTLIEAFDEEFGDRAVVTGTQGGMHVLVRLLDAENHGDFVERAREVGIGIYPADQYYLLEKPAAATFMMGYSSVDEAGIREGVQRLAELAGRAASTAPRP